MENHDRQHVAEVYTIGQVADLTGVPENTIRSWERRFGLPTPGRTTGKQRRYAPSDIELIQSIQTARDAGRTMDQAIADATSAKRIHPPTPLKVIAAAVGSPPANHVDAGPASTHASVRRLAGELARLNLPAANRMLSDAMLALPVEAVVRLMLLEASRSLRAMCIRGEVEPITLLVARDWIDRKIMAAYETSNPDSGDPHALVLDLDDGRAPSMAFAYGIALSRGGFQTTTASLGPAPSTARDLVVSLRPDCVVMHASTEDGHGARSGVANLIDNERDDADWTGLLVHTGRAPDDPDIPLMHAIGEDTLTIAQRLRQALDAHAGTNRERT